MFTWKLKKVATGWHVLAMFPGCSPSWKFSKPLGQRNVPTKAKQMEAVDELADRFAKELRERISACEQLISDLEFAKAKARNDV